MGRYRLVIVAESLDTSDESQSPRDKIPAAGATVKLYQPGTASVVGTATTGTPFATPLYATSSGGSTISPTQTASSTGVVVVWADRQTVTGRPLTCDVGIEYGGAAVVREYERFEGDPDDLAWITDLPTFDVSRPVLGISGLIEGDSNAEATNNATKLAAMYAAVAAIGGGRLRLKSNTSGKYWWLDNVSLNTGGPSVPINLFGDGGGETRLMRSSTSGAWLGIQPGSGFQTRPWLADFSIHHSGNVTSGADIEINPNSLNVYMTRVQWEPTFHQNGGVFVSDTGAMTCIEFVGSNCFANLYIEECRISSRVDDTPSTIKFSQTSGQNEMTIRGRSVVSTALPHPTTYVGGGICIDIACPAPARIDLISITDRTLITGGDYQIRLNGGCEVYQLVMDAVQLDQCNHNVYSVPTSFGIRTLQVRDTWAWADKVGFTMVGTSAQRLAVLDNVESNGVQHQFVNFDSVEHARITNCSVDLSPFTPTGAVAIKVAGASILEILDNYVNVARPAAVGMRAGIEVTSPASNNIVVKDNSIITQAGVEALIAPPGRTSGQIFAPNAIYDINQTAIERDRSLLGAAILDTHTTAALIWTPSWNDTTTSRTLETNGGKTLTNRTTAGTTSAAATDRMAYQGQDRCLLNFDGTQFASTPDSADLSFTSGGFSGWVFANVTDTASERIFFSKSDGTNFEYTFGVDSTDHLFLTVYDTSATHRIVATADAQLTTSQMGRLRLFGFSFDGTTTIVLYIDGSSVASTDVPSGTFTTLQNTTAPFVIGARATAADFSTATGFYRGRIGAVGVIPGVATAVQRLLMRHRMNAYFETGV